MNEFREGTYPGLLVVHRNGIGLLFRLDLLSIWIHILHSISLANSMPPQLNMYLQILSWFQQTKRHDRMPPEKCNKNYVGIDYFGRVIPKL